MTDSKATRLRRYLHDQVQNGKCYFKSREVAEDLSDLTPKQIGTMFRELSEDSDTELEVSMWTGGSKAATWYVSEQS